mmetsp:Transcript_16123/g.34850  ORF Transcript_16123/g.34850 Transcript_16123/m.34850 type:complete len:448 (+) Transcript_16123:506-1849(+)
MMAIHAANTSQLRTRCCPARSPFFGTRGASAHPFSVAIVLSLLLSNLSLAVALDNGVGRLPPMGYSTWNDLGCEDVTADSVRSVVSSLVSNNLHKLGYQYINIDDCWALERDGATGRLTPDFGAFPGGIKALADDVHSQGLKFGLYTDRGLWTCGARPGSAGREEIDSKTFADWGVDFLKIDSCNAPRTPREAMQQYVRWRDALNATGRSIFLSVCGWSPWYAEVGQALGNAWRMSRDVNGAREMWNAVAINSQLSRHAGPGAWNDPDCLIGSSPNARVSLSQTMSRTQFNLWSIMAAPLIIGANMRELNSFDLETYSNEEVIAVDQDPLARQGTILWQNCPPTNISALVEVAEAGKYDQLPHCQQLWAKPLLGGDWAALLVNWAPTATQMSIQPSNLRAMGLTTGADYRDVWRKEELGIRSDTFYVQVAGDGGSEMYRLRPSRVFL